MTLPADPKVAMIGDSVIAGLGVHGRSYGRLAGEALGSTNILRLARSTNTVLNAVTQLDRLRAFEPDLVIATVGGSDSLVHGGRALEKLLDRFAPKTWKGVEGLEPRPWFSDAKVERFRQKITMAAKLVLKHIGIRLTGGYQRVPMGQFGPALEELLAALDEIGCAVIMVGVARLDDRMWPRTNSEVDQYAAATRRAMAAYPDMIYIDPQAILTCWDDYCVDHAHLNEAGHAKLLEVVMTELAPMRSTLDSH